MPGESGSTSPELKRRKLRSSLESVSLIPSSLVGASHDISTFFKPKTPEIRRFYKAIGSDPDALTRAEIESANAALLKFYLLGKHTPTKTHSVVRESGEVAVITTEIPGFKPLANMTGTLESIDLISSGLVDIIVTNYVLQGVDPNGFNIGIDANGKAGIVDLANLLFPATCDYLGYPSTEVPVTGHNCYLLTTPSKDSCALTSGDIRSLPFLSGQGTRPWSWFNVEEHPEWWGTQFNMAVVQQVLRRLLIILILPTTTRESVIQSQVSLEKLNDIYFSYLPKHLELLRNTLLDMEEFRVFLSEPNIWESIVAEVQEYNQQFPKEKDAIYRIDLNALENNFNEIKNAGQKKETDRTLEKIIQEQETQFYEKLIKEFKDFVQARVPKNVSISAHNHGFSVDMAQLNVSERETFKIALFSWYQANMVDGLTEQDDGFVFEKINPHWQRVYNRYSHMTVRDLNKQLFGDRKVLAIRLDASDFVELSIDFSDGTEKFWDQLLTNLQSQGLISNYHTENSNFYFSIAALDNFSFEFTTQYGVLCQTLINQIFEYSVVETERCQDKVSGLFTNELLWPTGDTVNAHFTVLEEKGFISSYVEEGTKFFVVKDPQGMFFCLADRLGIDCSSDDASIIDELQPSSPISCAC